MSPFYDKFKTVPQHNVSDYTMVVCAHPYHGVHTYYLSTEDFQENIKGILTPCWINTFTVTIIPCSNN